VIAPEFGLEYLWTTPPLDTGIAWPRLLAVTVPQDCYKGATSCFAASYAFSTASVLLITSLFVDQRGQFETTRCFRGVSSILNRIGFSFVWNFAAYSFRLNHGDGVRLQPPL